jgi:holin-like protein
VSAFVAGLTWLLLFQCAGEVLVRLAGLPIPGPVAGRAVLLAALLTRRAVPDALSLMASELAKHL